MCVVSCVLFVWVLFIGFIVVACWLLCGVRLWLFVVCCVLDCCAMLVMHSELSVVCCWLSLVCCLLYVVCRVLFASSLFVAC